MNRIIIGHPVEYAMVGEAYVADTGDQSDAQVRERAATYLPPAGTAQEQAPAVRRARYCVVCRENTPCRHRRRVVREG